MNVYSRLVFVVRSTLTWMAAILVADAHRPCNVVAVTVAHRTHAICVLRQNQSMESGTTALAGRKVYDEAVREARVVVWGAADRICVIRLKAVLCAYVDAMERHGHVVLDPSVRSKLRQTSSPI